MKASKAYIAVAASIAAYKWIWAGGGAAVLAGIVALVVVYGGLFGPSGKAICKIALDRSSGYGVIPASSTLAGSAKSTDVSGRKTCTAENGGNKYIISVDIKCDDLKKDDCLSIYSVEREDGLSLYQVRALPDDDNGNPLPVGGAPAPDQAAAAAPGDTAAAPPAAAAPGSASQGAAVAPESSDVEVERPAAAPQQ